MPSNLISCGASRTADTLRVSEAPARRGRVARWALGLALTAGLGVGIASTRVTSNHTTSSHVSVRLVSDSSSTGVTGGPGNG
ncbi:MAG TPA: hypothetical protein VF120_10785 [Ktedonobacterales bacterium]